MTVGWHFDNTYSKLPDSFREIIKPVPVKNPELILLNENLAKELNLNFADLLIKKYTISRNVLHYFPGTLHYVCCIGVCSKDYPIAFGLPATVPIPVRSGPQGSVTILYCAWSFVTKKCSKTKRNAGLFLGFFSTPFGI